MRARVTRLHARRRDTYTLDITRDAHVRLHGIMRKKTFSLVGDDSRSRDVLVAVVLDEYSHLSLVQFILPEFLSFVDTFICLVQRISYSKHNFHHPS